MTRKEVYIGVVIGLIITILSTTTSLFSLTWITYDLSSSPPNRPVYDHIGLFTRCSPSGCGPFPSTKFCSSLTTLHNNNNQPPPPPRPYSYAAHPHHQTVRELETAPPHQQHPSTFCTKWRSAGALLNISLIFTLVASITTVFILLSKTNSRGRRHGWKILAGLIGLAGMLEVAVVGIVAEVKDYEQMFQIPGYELGEGWWMGLGGGLTGVVVGLGVGVMAMMGWMEERGVGEGDRGRCV